MSSSMQDGKESCKGLSMLRHFTRKLQRVLPILPSTRSEQNGVHFDEDLEAATKMVPNDVKEGHFAVVAVNGGNPKRFILDLSFLANPAFLSLLEQAEEEYGFQQKGPLAVPCHPEELQKILEES
ncbi:hypothetical protein SLEP1_g48530 [Rubroshorea leprosula]|uniref:Uncharacterized protein n=1 Tax=Rubroshorea leprosula TaxID=152421 RepID=A0AAV5LTV6_9ROSI|nr:hypothetical protein SLEP1_g48530 [Rubroshorea leprosula]